MGTSDRQRQVLDLVRANSRVQISDLSEQLGVSRETIRKDLVELDDRGLVYKVRGGALSRGAQVETAYEARKRLNTDAKRAIAAKAAEQVEPGMTLYLDYGTTTHLVASQLAAIGGLTVVTAALPIASQLSVLQDVTVIVPAGVIRSNESSLYGPLTSRTYQFLNFDLGFFSSAGADAVAGATNHHLFESDNSATALARCQRSAYLVDGSKIGHIAPHRTAGIHDFDVVISDAADASRLLGDDERGLETKLIVVKGN